MKSVQIRQRKKLYNTSFKSNAVLKTASKKVPKVSTPNTPTVKAEHPTYFEMITAAITARKGQLMVFIFLSELVWQKASSVI